MKIDINQFTWTREPADYSISDDKVEIITSPHTDLWQRTYYHFRNDNAPVFQMKTEEKYFSFAVKTEFESKHRFDQCGMVQEKYSLVSMHVARRNLRLRRHLPIWS